jgi:hypothetical protein
LSTLSRGGEDPRLELLVAWLADTCGLAGAAIAPASEDASFRRYFRVEQAGRSLIAMDAPPPHEDCRPYVHVARLLRAAGVNAPEILAEDLERGFLLLTDFGTRTYLDVLDDANAQALYLDAIDALVRWQLASREGELPPYDEALLRRELDLFPDWYVARHLGVALAPAQRAALDNAFRALLASNLAEPRVFVHRDYHSRNLMVTEPNPGVLDFQDAVYGPVSYDLVSLLKDAYVVWEEERVLDLAIRYWERARKAGLPVAPAFDEFYRAFEWMGAQRHVKVLGIFARLYHRDGKDRYLADLPRVMAYLRAVCTRYSALAPVARLLDELENRQVTVGYTF